MTWGPADLNQFPFFIDGGLIYEGLIPWRDHDVASVGFAYGKWSRKLANSDRDDRDINGSSLDPRRYEMILDFNYKIVITPWLYLLPDMQYIIYPGGRGDAHNAYVLGFRVGVTF